MKYINLIYKKLDSSLFEDEKKILEEKLAHSEDLRRSMKELIKMRNAFSASGQKSFKPFFEERLLAKLSEKPESANGFELFLDSFTVSFKRIALSAVIIIILLISLNLSSSDKISLESVLGIPEVTVEETLDPINLFAVE